MGQIGNTMEQEKRINGADLSGQFLVSNIDKKQRTRWYKAHFICYEILFKIKYPYSKYVQYNLVKPPPSVQPDFGVITSLAIN